MTIPPYLHFIDRKLGKKLFIVADSIMMMGKKAGANGFVAKITSWIEDPQRHRYSHVHVATISSGEFLDMYTQIIAWVNAYTDGDFVTFHHTILVVSGGNDIVRSEK